MTAATTDPDELLEVFDARGRPTGHAKTRREIHEKGLWHLAFFCWIVTSAGNVVLQRRAPWKDVWPGRFDASAAGHVRFGENRGQAARELDGELGLTIDVAALEPVMRHRQEHRHDNGLLDREVHDIYLLRCDRRLEDYRPGPEVAGLAVVPLRSLVQLTERSRLEIPTVLVTFDAHRQPSSRTPLVLQREDLVPYDPGYLAAIALAAAASTRASCC